MPDLTASTALGDIMPRSIDRGSLVIAENSGLALASLALRRDCAPPAPYGLALPAPGGWAATGRIAALWTGVGQWLIEGEDQAETDFASAIAAQCPDCSVTEQTDGFVAFEVRSINGEAPLQALIEKLLNLDPVRFKPGMGCRTAFQHGSVFAVRRSALHFAIMGMRSAAASIWHELETAATRLTVGAI